MKKTEKKPEPATTVEGRFVELHKLLSKKRVRNASTAAAILTATEAVCGELAEMTGRIHMLEEALLGTTPVEMIDDQGSVVPTRTSDVRSFEPDICRRLDRIADALEVHNRPTLSEAVDAAAMRAENPPKGE